MPSDARLAPKERRRILKLLARERLAALTDHFGLEVAARRSIDAHVDADRPLGPHMQVSRSGANCYAPRAHNKPLGDLARTGPNSAHPDGPHHHRDQATGADSTPAMGRFHQLMPPKGALDGA